MNNGEYERLVMLAEECAEVGQAVAKILRHGRNSYHPDAPEISNTQLLIKEIYDVFCIIDVMSKQGDFGIETEIIDDYNARIDTVLDKIWKHKLKYTHHQL